MEGTIHHRHGERDLAADHFQGVKTLGMGCDVEPVVELQLDGVQLPAPAHESVTEWNQNQPARLALAVSGHSGTLCPKRHEHRIQHRQRAQQAVE